MSDQFSFEGQRSGEDVLVVWRKHPVVLAKPGLMIVSIIFIVALVLKYLGASGYSSVAIVVGLVLSIGIALYDWFKWWNGMYILTTERIIDVDQRNPFHRVVGELPIENIQDAAYEVKGLMATLLNYGNVVVQTIGGGTTITMELVEAPYSVQQAILEARNTHVKPSSSRDHTA